MAFGWLAGSDPLGGPEPDPEPHASTHGVAGAPLPFPPSRPLPSSGKRPDERTR